MEPNCIVEDNGRVRIRISGDTGIGSKVHSDRYVEVSDGRDGGGEDQGGNGGINFKLPRQVDVTEEISNIWRVVELQGQNIEELYKVKYEYKNLLKDVFSVMSEEQLAEIKSMHGEDASEILKEMIDWAVSLREVQKLFNSIENKREKIDNKTPFQSVNKVNIGAQVSPTGGNSSAGISPNIENADVGADSIGVTPAITSTPQTGNELADAEQQNNEEQMRYEEEMRKWDEEKRKYNVIIEGLDETIWGGEGDRVRIMGILREMKLGHRVHELNRVERIGRISKYTKKRLIIASFDSKAAAFEMTDKWYRLRDSRTYYNVHVRRDLTRTQREDEKKKRDLAKEQKNNGPHNNQLKKDEAEPNQRRSNNTAGTSASNNVGSNPGGNDGVTSSDREQGSRGFTNCGGCSCRDQGARPRPIPSFQGNGSTGNRGTTT